jgi:hypothetical protein
MQLLGMHNHTLPGLLQYIVHSRRHFHSSSHRIQAMVRIPHVADDDRCLLRSPRFSRFFDGPFPVGALDARAQLHVEPAVLRGKTGYRRQKDNRGSKRNTHSEVSWVRSGE